nr:MAG TPA: hypothetical protein [Caudoviricetes sp.]
MHCCLPEGKLYVFFYIFFFFQKKFSTIILKISTFLIELSTITSYCPPFFRWFYCD